MKLTNPSDSSFDIATMKYIYFSVLICTAVLLFGMPIRSLADLYGGQPVQLPMSVRQQLDKAGIPLSAVGIYVHPVGASNPALTLNADVAMNPASVMKLITTYAGLEILGPAYVWQTLVYAHGRIDKGVLHGDLVIKGYGDPKLDLEHFWLMVDRLRQTGLQEITGNLILDHSYYDLPWGDPGTFDGQPYRTYNILPEALLINYRSTALHLMPDSDKKQVRVVADPIPASVHVVNNLKLTDRRCGFWRNQVDIVIEPSGHLNNVEQVVLNGSYSARCGRQTVMFGLHDSATYARDLFKRFWTQQGGVFQGEAIIAEAPVDLNHIETYYSPPLAEIIRGINKYSNNIAARQLYLAFGTAGSVGGKQQATLEKSEYVLRRWLAAKQLNFSELVIENGSGLSRIGRINARHMGQLLLTAFNSPVMPEFISSMPIASVDGTMRGRMIGTAVSGFAHIKTGTLNGVKAMAGYILNQSGQRVVVVMFVNHVYAERSRVAMDMLLEWVFSGNVD